MNVGWVRYTGEAVPPREGYVILHRLKSGSVDRTVRISSDLHYVTHYVYVPLPPEPKWTDDVDPYSVYVVLIGNLGNYVRLHKSPERSYWHRYGTHESRPLEGWEREFPTSAGWKLISQAIPT